jgi:hypothetical protein
MPVLCSSWRAARRATAAPTTTRPLACHASVAPASAYVFAGAGLPDHHGNAIACEREPAHHLDLLAAQRRSSGQRALDQPLAHDAHASTLRRRRVLEDAPFELQQLGRRVDPLVPHERHDPAIAAPEHIGSTESTLADGQRHHTVRGEEAICDPLDLCDRQAAVGREALAKGLEDVAPRERRPTTCQPVGRT